MTDLYMQKEKWGGEQIKFRRSRKVRLKIGNYGVTEVKRREFSIHITAEYCLEVTEVKNRK